MAELPKQLSVMEKLSQLQISQPGLNITRGSNGEMNSTLEHATGCMPVMPTCAHDFWLGCVVFILNDIIILKYHIQ